MRARWTGSAGKAIAEHRQSAARLFARRLILDDVLVLGEHVTLHMHDVGDDPCRRQTMTAEPAVQNDEIAARRADMVLIAQRRGQALDEIE